MLKFFKHSYIAQLVVIVLLVVTLWIPVFISQAYEMAIGSPTTPLYNIIASIFGNSSVAISILAFIVFISSVFFFNSMLSVNQLVTRNSSIGAFVFVLCMCCIPMQDEYYPFILASPFIMMTMQTIYLVYLVEKPEPYLMNAGFFIAIASMFYFPSIILIIWVLMAMMIMKIRGLRYYIIPILGLTIPYFLLFVYFYFSSTLLENAEAYSVAFSDLNFMKLHFKTSEIVVFVIDIVLFSLSLLIVKSRDADNSVSTRKKVGVTILLFAFSVVMLFLQKPVMCNGLIFLVIAVFVSIALCYVKKTKIVDILMVVMMIAIVVNQYLPLFGIVL